MKIRTAFPALLAIAIVFGSCKKDNVIGGNNTGGGSTSPDTTGTLKGAASFPIGIAIGYSLLKNDPAYAAIVKREASNITFDYNMKHGAIVKNDGSFDFTRADELVNLATIAGLEVFGHTLAWHQNQNATYLNSLFTGDATTGAPNIIPNGGFEAGSGSSFTNWAVFNGASAFSEATAAADVYEGSRALKVNVTAAMVDAANPWKVQVVTDPFTTVADKIYKAEFYAKATAGGQFRVSMEEGGYQFIDVTPTTSWAKYSFNFTAKAAQSRVRFNLAAAAGTYLLDNVTVVDLSAAPPPSNAQITAAVDSALSRFVRATMMRYAGKVKAWDVVNEPMADGVSGLRSRANTPVPAGSNDYFLWMHYLGRDYALKAFQYAKAADPGALLFINDYNLEYNSIKLDSLISYVAELKTKGAHIDGIGTQMHISINTSKTGIDNMFKKLAATGLKVRVSELDVRVNPAESATFTLNSVLQQSQADMYKYVVESYLRNVPAAQRHGLTIWGVADKDSWINTYMKKVDFPLLFDNDYQKKPAYFAVLLALKGK